MRASRMVTLAAVAAGAILSSTGCTADELTQPTQSVQAETSRARGSVAVTVSPTADTLQVGDTLTLQAVITGARRPNPKATWQSTDTTKVTVSAGGTIRALAAGSVFILVTYRGEGAYATIVVKGPAEAPATPVSAVAITQDAVVLAPGGSTQLTANALDSAGAPIDGVSLAWQSADTTIATVNGQGLVRAGKAGHTRIVAKEGDESDSVTVTVDPEPVPVASVSVSLSSASLTVGQTTQATATALDASGQALEGRTVSWSSNSASVATVSSSGLVTAVGAGTAAITAAIEGVTKSANVTVSSPSSGGGSGSDVVLSPGANIQDAVNRYPAGTHFRLKAGTYSNQRVVPKSGNAFIGEPGAILDGGGSAVYAFEKGSSPYPSNVRIEGLEIRHYASPDHMGPILAGGGGASEGTVGWVVEDNDIHHNRVGGVRVGHKTVVRNNKLHHNGWFGLSGAGDSVLVEGNEISYNNLSSTSGTVTCDPNWGGGGFKFVYTRWLVVRNNVSHHNSGAGMWTDINNIYTLYEGNRVEDNTHVGIFHEISYDAVIRNNIVLRNGFGKPSWLWGPGILIAASPNVEVYGNKVAGNYNGVTVVQQVRGEKATYGVHEVNNVRVHDNDIDVSARGLVGYGQDYTSDFNTLSRVRFSGNRYQLGSNSKPFHWNGGTKSESEWRNYGHDQSGTFSR
jgi:parallel beta-helix repeat protein